VGSIPIVGPENSVRPQNPIVLSRTNTSWFINWALTSRCYDYPPPRWVQVELQKDSYRVDRFIAAFEKLYGRKPRPDAQGNFTVHVAQDMEMSVGGARYYIRAATEGKSRYVRPE